MMEISGQKELNLPQERVWEILHQPQILEKITPGLEQLTPLDEPQTYNATFKVKIGPVSASFRGRIAVEDLEPQSKMQLNIEMQSPIGNVAAKALIELKQQNRNATLLTYTSNAHLTGTLLSVGQRFAKPTIQKILDQFVSNLQQIQE